MSYRPNVGEAEAVVKAAQLLQQDPPTYQRNIALIQGLYATGARVKDLLQLTFGDIVNSKANMIQWKLKNNPKFTGNPVMIVDFTVASLDALEVYAEIRKRMNRPINASTALYPVKLGHK